MRKKRPRPLHDIMRDLDQFPSKSTVETVDSGVIIVTLPAGGQAEVHVDEEYDDGLPDPNVPTF